MGGMGRMRTVALVSAMALAGCGVTDTGPMGAGAPARGQGTAEASQVLRVYFLTPHGMWPVARPAAPGAGPQAALDALLAGPTRAERARGLVTALPSGTRRAQARASRGSVELYLPWLVSELGRMAVHQLVCTVSAAPGIPGGRQPADVVVRVRESGLSQITWDVTCDESGTTVPVEVLERGNAS
jgi:Sporulation and spore germination